jgi:hypothetical protein
MAACVLWEKRWGMWEARSVAPIFPAPLNFKAWGGSNLSFVKGRRDGVPLRKTGKLTVS